MSQVVLPSVRHSATTEAWSRAHWGRAEGTL